MSYYFTHQENLQVFSYVVNTLNLKLKKPLTSSTIQEFCTCPFHKDNTPSLSANLEKGYWKCFSCGDHGTINGLAKKAVGKSAFKILNKEFSSNTEFITIVNRAQTPEDLKKTPDVHIRLDGAMSRLTSECLMYLKNRGITVDVAKSFHMSYFDRGFINGTPFNKRLLVPVYEKGMLLSYEGRDITGQSKKKVLYPSGSSVNTLYDIDNLDRNEPLYLVEGLMDLAVLRAESFFKNSSSLFGSSPTRRKASLLSEFKHIVWIPDNDDAGVQSVMKYSEMIDSTQTRISILPVPSFSKDVGDLPKHNFDISARRDQWLKKMISFNQFLTNYLKR